MNRHTVLAVTVFCIGVACTRSESGTPDDSSSSGAPPPPGGSSGASGRPGDDPTERFAKGGLVTLLQTDEGTSGGSKLQALASFWGGASTTGGETAMCVESVEGACAIVECERSPDSRRLPNAGDISVISTREILLAPDDTGGYPPKVEDDRFFEPGGEVRISAAGAEAPEFDKTLVSPSAISVSAPLLPAAPGKLTLARASGLTLAWTGSTGDVQALVASASEAKSTTILCTFRADGGGAAISSSILSKLAPGEGTLHVGAATSDVLELDGWRVRVSAIAVGAGGAIVLE